MRHGDLAFACAEGLAPRTTAISSTQTLLHPDRRQFVQELPRPYITWIERYGPLCARERLSKASGHAQADGQTAPGGIEGVV
jgi:hypothetical protein